MSTMQTLVQNQYMVLQLLAGKQSKQQMATLRITMWNANGVSRHNLEVTQFLHDNHIDIMLLVETHLISKYNFQIRGYTFYRTDHPDGKAHGGTGILIRERIKNHFHQRFATNYLQTITQAMETSPQPLSTVRLALQFLKDNSWTSTTCLDIAL